MRLSTIGLFVLIVAALAVLIGLGMWQLQRNEWKQDLVAKSHERTNLAPIEVEAALPLTTDELDYRRITVTGDWLTDDVQFIANRIRASTRGEEIVVPVLPAAGGPAVLVNMGWIPDGLRDDVLPEILAEAGTPIEGLARNFSELEGRRIASGAWTSFAPTSIGEELGYPVQPWIVIAGAERRGDVAQGAALPVQGWQRFENYTPHIEYALTWFGIAAALVVIATVRLVVVPWRARRGDTPTSGNDIKR